MYLLYKMDSTSAWTRLQRHPQCQGQGDPSEPFAKCINKQRDRASNTARELGASMMSGVRNMRNQLRSITVCREGEITLP